MYFYTSLVLGAKEHRFRDYLRFYSCVFFLVFNVNEESNPTSSLEGSLEGSFVLFYLTLFFGLTLEFAVS